MEAANSGNWRQAWACGRAMSQQSLGPKGRIFHALAEMTPDVDDWIQAMKQPGPKGGCDATEIWNGEQGDLGSFFRLNQLALVPTSAYVANEVETCSKPQLREEQAEELGAEDFRRMQAQLQHHSRGFAVPPWSIPRDFWRVLLCDAGADENYDAPNLKALVRRLCSLIRKTTAPPLEWCLSKGCAIPKYNNKTSTRAFRLLHLLDPLSKTWIAGIWGKHCFNLQHTSFGFIKGRRREEVGMLLRALQYRLGKNKCSLLLCSFDVANAFPSIDWNALDSKPLKSFNPADRALLSRRYRNALCLVTDSSLNAGVFRPLTDNRQGDGPAAQQFARAFEAIIKKWSKDLFTLSELSMLAARDPWSKIPVFLGSLLFADDLLKIIPVVLPVGALNRCLQLITTLRTELQQHKMDLNLDKLQLLASWVGPGSARNRRDFLDLLGSTDLAKICKSTLKHLGMQ
ncbi:unnamed protein product [Polarella glacialis]|uniref:Reverse transcriptase domain-containing protein n=1 Tax=Polarella glacialis TaxID=89957 RepID=A0A813H5S6_POLGL|nr:unnamed protein product [Polarella glacialis]